MGLLSLRRSSRISNRWSSVTWGLLWGLSAFRFPTVFVPRASLLPYRRHPQLVLQLVFLCGRVVSPTPNPQPGGPGGHSVSGPYPSFLSVWVALPGVQDFSVSLRHANFPTMIRWWPHSYQDNNNMRILVYEISCNCRGRKIRSTVLLLLQKLH